MEGRNKDSVLDRGRSRVRLGQVRLRAMSAVAGAMVRRNSGACQDEWGRSQAGKLWSVIQKPSLSARDPTPNSEIL